MNHFISVILCHFNVSELLSFIQRYLSLRRIVEIYNFNIPPAPRVYISNSHSDDFSILYDLQTKSKYLETDLDCNNYRNKSEFIVPDLVKTNLRVFNNGDEGTDLTISEIESHTNALDSQLTNRLEDLKIQISDMQRILSEIVNQNKEQMEMSRLHESNVFQPPVTSTPACRCVCKQENLQQSPMSMHTHLSKVTVKPNIPPPPNLPPPPPPPQNSLSLIVNKHKQNSFNQSINNIKRYPNMSDVLKDISKVKLKPVNRSETFNKKLENKSQIDFITEALRKKFHNATLKDTDEENDSDFSHEWNSSYLDRQSTSVSSFDNINCNNRSFSSTGLLAITEEHDLDKYIFNPLYQKVEVIRSPRDLLRKVDKENLPVIISKELENRLSS